MKKLFLFSIALFLLAPLRPAHAHISDDEKELELEFIQAKDLFHEGETGKTTALLKDLASDPRHPAYAQVKAAAAIADLLRWQYGKGKVDDGLSKDLDKLQADLTKALEFWGDAPLKKVLDPSLAYLAETQKFLADKKPVSARPEDAEKEADALARDPRYAKVSPEGRRVLALGKVSRKLEKENPLESVLLDEQLWQEAQNVDYTALAQAASPEIAEEIANEATYAAGRINKSYWAKKRTFDLGPLPDVKIFQDILKQLSEALARKDMPQIEALFDPVSPFKAGILSAIQSGEITALEYRDCGSPQWSETGMAGVSVTCKVKATRNADGKTESAEGEKMIGFRKDKDTWRIQQV